MVVLACNLWILMSEVYNIQFCPRMAWTPGFWLFHASVPHLWKIENGLISRSSQANKSPWNDSFWKNSTRINHFCDSQWKSFGIIEYRLNNVHWVFLVIQAFQIINMICLKCSYLQSVCNFLYLQNLNFFLGEETVT